MEQQQTLYPTQGKGNNNTTKFGVFTYSRKLMLQTFYKDRVFAGDNYLGLSLVELNQQLGSMLCTNTIQSSLNYLKHHKFVLLVLRGVGETRRRKYYKLTEKGDEAVTSLAR